MTLEAFIEANQETFAQLKDDGEKQNTGSDRCDGSKRIFA